MRELSPNAWGLLGITDGIVVGRLQHDGRWSFSRGSDLKQRFIAHD